MGKTNRFLEKIDLNQCARDPALLQMDIDTKKITGQTRMAYIRSLSGSFFSVRRWFQLVFLVITLAIGIQFTWFVFHLEKGIVPDFNRPPGVEAFLPISALVSLKHTVSTWTINDIHPSGLVLFLIVCATALVVKKGSAAGCVPSD